MTEGTEHDSQMTSGVRTAMRPRAQAMAVLRWGLFIVGVILFTLIYASFLNWATTHAAASGMNGWDGIFVALPPAEIAFIAGGGVAAKLADRSRLAFTWCAALLGCFVMLDGLIWVYYDVGSCLVIC